jgi:2-aminoadipate transaminase
VAFPGLRVGWVVAPRAVTARLAEAKQRSDLHSDQLSQAILHRFAASGELERHAEQARQAGLERLQTALAACDEHLPPGTRFTRPEGGMNLWVELPPPLTGEDLLRATEAQGVSFLPGSYFSAGRKHHHGLRISFGGLPPQNIEQGIRIIGAAAAKLLLRAQERAPLEPMAALV